MNIAQIVSYLYPDADPMTDYQVGDDGDGLRIMAWAYAKAPQPDAATLAANEQAASAAFAWSSLKRDALAALQDSDITVLRCFEHGVALPSEWVSYRAALRAIVSAVAGNAAAGLPVRPAYPAGT